MFQPINKFFDDEIEKEDSIMEIDTKGLSIEEIAQEVKVRQEVQKKLRDIKRKYQDTFNN